MSKAIDMAGIFSDFKLQRAFSGDRHYRDDWINFPCPRCQGQNTGNHMGYHSRYGNSFTCWRCGSHSVPEVLQVLLKIPYREVYEILAEYTTSGSGAGKTKEIKYRKILKVPTGIQKLTIKHKKYLKNRGLNVRELIQLYNVQCTSDKSDLKNRIYIPISLDYKDVSYQTRDISNKAKNKYITCSKDDEAFHHKHLVYGADLVPGDACIVTEGIVDVWKLGPGAVCTFGIKFKQEQINFIADRYKHVGILYDQERQAQKMAKQMKAELELYNVDVTMLKIDENDAGDMTLKKARAFSKRFLDKYSLKLK